MTHPDQAGVHGSGTALLEAAAPAPALPPDAIHKLATILHTAESGAKRRCGPNSRGCRMRHRLDAASILMDFATPPAAGATEQ